MARRPLIVGLTGGVGCGKTVVAKEFARLGAVVISGDQAGHEVVERDADLRKKLARHFGQDILTEGGINRRKLARRAFASPAGRHKLNELIHPALVRELTRRVRAARGRRNTALVIVDAALLVEWQMKIPLDILVAVWASRANRLAWLQRRGWTKAEILDRMRAQLPFSARKTVADCVLRNDGDLTSLRRKAKRLWQKLLPDR